MNSRLLSALIVAVLVVGCNKADDATPTAPTAPSPVTNAFTTRLPLGGAISRAFNTSAAGQISVTLKSTTPSATIGLGLGVPLSANGIANCTLAISVATSGGSTPQIAAPAEAGTYCVVAYDLGDLTESIDLDASITYP